MTDLVPGAISVPIGQAPGSVPVPESVQAERQNRYKLEHPDSSLLDAEWATINSGPIGSFGRIAGHLQDDENAEQGFTLPSDLSQYLKDRGIKNPDLYMPMMERASSQSSLDGFVSDALQLQHNDDVLSSHSWYTRMALAATDPSYLPLDFVAMPLSVAGNASRLTRMIRAGLTASTYQVAMDWMRSGSDPRVTAETYLIDGASAFALGSLAGVPGFHGKTMADVQKATDDLVDFARTGDEKKLDSIKESARGKPGEPEPAVGPRKTWQEVLDGHYAQAKEEQNIQAWHPKFRFSLAAEFAKTGSDFVKRMGRLFVTDRLGYTDRNIAVKEGATELHDRLFHGINHRLVRASRTAWDAYRTRIGMKINDEVHHLAIREMLGDYMRGRDVPLPTEFKHVADAFKKVTDELGDQARDAALAGFETFTRDGKYWLPRRASEGGVNRIFHTLGVSEEDMVQLYKESIINARREAGLDVDEELTAKVAKALVRHYRKTGQHENAHPYYRYGEDTQEAVEQLLKDEGFSAEEAERAAESLSKNNKSAIKSGHARVLMDESHERDLWSPKLSQYVKVGVADLWEKDALLLTHNYAKNITGWVAMGRKLGVRSPKEMTALRTEILNQVRESAPNRVDRMEKTLDILFNRLQGRSTFKNPKGIWARASRIFRSLAFVSMMNQAGFSAVADLGVLFNKATHKNIMRAMPDLRTLYDLAQKGALDDTTAMRMREAGLFGSGFYDYMPIMRNTVAGGDMLSADALSSVERALESGKRITATVSGLGPVTDYIQRLSCLAGLYDLMDFAKMGELKPHLTRQLRYLGMDEAEQAKVFAKLKDAKTLSDVDWTKWDVEEREALSAYLDRLQTHVTSETGLSTTTVEMHNPVGSVLWQFRNFIMNSYENILLHSLHNLDDFRTWAMYAYSAVFAGMAWTARTYLNTIGDEKRRKKLLTPENIISSAFQQSSYSSVIPDLVDLGSHMAGSDGVFQHGRSIGIGAAESPALSEFTSLRDSIRLASLALRPDRQITQGDWRRATSGWAFHTATGVRNINNYIGTLFPKSDPGRNKE